MGRSRGSRSSSTSSSITSSLSSVRPLSSQQRNQLSSLSESLMSKCTTPSAANAKQLWSEHIEIRTLVERIVDIEKKGNLARRLPTNRKAMADKLLLWMRDNGAHIHDDLLVDHFGEQGLGLRVRAGLPMNEMVLSIPRKLLMSVESAYRSEIGALIAQDPLLNCMDNVALALHLLLEKNSPASFFEPFINTLPHSFSNALHLSLRELEALKGSPALEEALKLYKFVGRQYAYFYKKFESSMLKDYFTYTDYVWAVSAVMTRQNKIPAAHKTLREQEDSSIADGSTDDASICCLVPFFDLANHSSWPEVISTDFDLQSDSVVCKANQDFEANQAFTIFYGRRGNRELLLHNGFVVEENVFSDYELKLGISKNDSLAKDKCQLISNTLKLTQQSSFHMKKNLESIEPELLAFLRVMCCNDKDQLSKWINDENAGNALRRAEVDLEDTVDSKLLDFLKTRCQLLLKSYPKSTENNEDEEPGPMVKMCLVLCQEERQILQKIIKLVDAIKSQELKSSQEVESNQDAVKNNEVQNVKDQSNDTRPLSEGFPTL